MMARHSISPRESAPCPTGVQEVLARFDRRPLWLAHPKRRRAVQRLVLRLIAHRMPSYRLALGPLTGRRTDVVHVLNRSALEEENTMGLIDFIKDAGELIYRRSPESNTTMRRSTKRSLRPFGRC